MSRRSKALRNSPSPTRRRPAGDVMLAAVVLCWMVVFGLALPRFAASGDGAASGDDLDLNSAGGMATWVKQLGADASHRRIDAARALADYGPQAAEAVPELIKLLEADNIDERVAAANALGSIGPEAAPAIASLIQHLSDVGASEDGRSIWITYSKALAGVGQPAVATIVEKLNTEQPNVYNGLTGALATMQPAPLAATPALIRELKHRQGDFKLATLFALVNMGVAAEPAVPMLIEALDDENFHVQYASCRVLGVIGKQAHAAVPKLIERLQNGNASVRGHAALALGAIGPVEGNDALGALVAALDDYSNPVRDRTLTGLGLMGPAAESVLDRVKVLVNEGNNRVEAAKTWFLISGGDEQALQTLISMTDDYRVELESIVALGSLGHSAAPAVDMLTEKLESEDESVRAESAIALGRMGSAAQSAVDRLERLKADPELDVRQHAAQAIKRIQSSSRE